MRTMLIAVTLLAMALVPAVAQEIQGPYNQDVDVQIYVAEYGELWHSANLVSLTLHDGGSYFGKTLEMYLNGNIPFDVYVSGDTTIVPEQVISFVGSGFAGFDAGGSKWDAVGDDLYRLWTGHSLTPDCAAWVQFNAGTGTSTPVKVESYEPPTLPADASARTVDVLYAICGSGTAAPTGENPGALKVIYTMQDPNGTTP